MGAGVQRWWRDPQAERALEFERFDARYRGGVVARITTPSGHRAIYYADGSRVFYAPGSIRYCDGI